jgi:hypothetical protein
MPLYKVREWVVRPYFSEGTKFYETRIQMIKANNAKHATKTVLKGKDGFVSNIIEWKSPTPTEKVNPFVPQISLEDQKKDPFKMINAMSKPTP